MKYLFDIPGRGSQEEISRGDGVQQECKVDYPKSRWLSSMKLSLKVFFKLSIETYKYAKLNIQRGLCLMKAILQFYSFCRRKPTSRQFSWMKAFLPKSCPSVCSQGLFSIFCPFCRVRDINAVVHQYVPMFHVKRSQISKATDSGAEEFWVKITCFVNACRSLEGRFLISNSLLLNLWPMRSPAEVQKAHKKKRDDPRKNVIKPISIVALILNQLSWW